MRHHQFPEGTIQTVRPAMSVSWYEQSNSVTLRTYPNEPHMTLDYDQARALYKALFHLFGPIEFEG